MSRSWWRIAAGIACVSLPLTAVLAHPGARHRAWRLASGDDMASRTIAERLAEFGAAAEARLAPRCVAAGVAWPPSRVVLAAFKDARRLELHAPGDEAACASSVPGPSSPPAAAPARSCARGTARFPKASTPSPRSTPTAPTTSRCGWITRMPRISRRPDATAAPRSAATS